MLVGGKQGRVLLLSCLQFRAKILIKILQNLDSRVWDNNLVLKGENQAVGTMNLDNWIYAVLYGKARTGKMSKQQVLGLSRLCTDGLSESGCWNTAKVCGRTFVGGITL